MRNAFIAICICVLFPAFADASPASGRIELRVLSKSVEDRPAFGLNGYFSKPFKYGLGVSAWLQIEEGWAEGYAGVTYSPWKWLEVSLSAGVEQAKDPWRVAGSLWLGFGPFTSLSIAENGGSGWWYQSVNEVRITSWLKAGAMIKRFVGLGPRLDIAIPRTPISIWAAYLLYDPETNSVDTERVLAAIVLSL